MKALTIFFFASSVIAVPFIKSCGELNIPIFKPQDRVDVFNHWRRLIMNEIGVSNMMELKYDPNLEDEIRKMKSCEDIIHGSNYRVSTDEGSKRIVQNLVKNLPDEGPRGPREFLPDAAEYLNPAQTFVAWCDLNVKCSRKHVDDKNQKKMFSRDQHETDTVVIFGPKGTYFESDFKMGKPGSNCPNGIVPPKPPNATCESNCGLCKGPEVPPRIPFTEISDSVAPSVNAIFILPILFMVNIVNAY
ncbi:hypothetical protein CAEBREN_17590 [Caenorhabditis brenneri]|uniref:SCP domain-containing protein n=1 Tax=Caenorhabditis brenneri TaxID=135651 RepID=G0NPJ3_CAEBE|nr:hypothetical protein CAEBREN_17590 [Caenorhabditis brenneri]